MKIKVIFQNGGQNYENSKFVANIKGVVLIIQWGQYLPEVALSVTVFKIYNIFPFRQIQNGGQNLEKS